MEVSADLALLGFPPIKRLYGSEFQIINYLINYSRDKNCQIITSQSAVIGA